MIKKRFLKEWGMTDLYSKLDNTAFCDWIKNAQKQPFFYHIYLILW
ncbi:hypothetical protein HpVa75_12640 [Helicobacter pylori]